MRLTRLYAYKLPPETFEPWDKFFVSRETVVPVAGPSTPSGVPE